jgi:hypothetical protein
MPQRILYDIGYRFPGTRLTVLENLPPRKRNSYALCLCDCGREIAILIARVKNGNTKSCGCLATEKKREVAREKNITHGLSGHSLYFIWKSIKSRCGNSKDKDYKWYGGRGIRLCNEWQKNFQAFFDASIKAGWREGLQIDRIDNDKGYEPGNIHFVTSKENNRNKRSAAIL